MKTKNNLFIRLEVIWWLMTGVLAAVFLIPIYIELPSYIFFWDNLLFIVAFFTFSRLIFFLRFSLIANQKYIQLTLLFLCVYIAFILIQKLTGFRVFIDENGPEAIVGNLAGAKQSPMINYIKTEMVFFGVGSIVACVLLPFRLVASIWKEVNAL